LKEKIIPASKEVFDATPGRLSLWEIRYLELLDAQRTLFEAKQQYLEALVTYHQTHADVNDWSAEI